MTPTDRGKVAEALDCDPAEVTSVRDDGIGLVATTAWGAKVRVQDGRVEVLTGAIRPTEPEVVPEPVDEAAEAAAAEPEDLPALPGEENDAPSDGTVEKTEDGKAWRWRVTFADGTVYAEGETPTKKAGWAAVDETLGPFRG